MPNPTVYRIDELKIDMSSKARMPRTAVIPAAGMGTRLGTSQPKLLYPILGKPLFERSIDILRDSCSHFVFIVAPGVDRMIRSRLKELTNNRFDVIVQPRAEGMGQAVSLSKPYVQTPHCVVMWVDQVALTSKTLAAAAALQDKHPNANLILPTIERQDPYIAFTRDASGRIKGVLQRREGDTMPAKGENDCGLFFFRTAPLFSAIESLMGTALRGRQTKELNLLPLIPTLDGQEGDVITVQIQDQSESIGLNTPAEAQLLENLLRQRNQAHD